MVINVNSVNNLRLQVSIILPPYLAGVDIKNQYSIHCYMAMKSSFVQSIEKNVARKEDTIVIP